MNLRPRFLLLTVLFFVAVAVPSWWGVRMLAEGIVEQWAVRYAERVVLYDKSRTLQPILREVALSRQLAQSQFLREWARSPDDAALDLMGERLRAAVAAWDGLRDAHGRKLGLSLSIGGHVAAPGEGLDAVLERGDRTLYTAKAAGRNAYRSSRQAERV